MGSMPGGGGARGQNLEHLVKSISVLESISWQILIKKHSYLDHWNPVGLAFIPRHQTQGSALGGGARGQNLVHLQKVGFLC